MKYRLISILLAVTLALSVSLTASAAKLPTVKPTVSGALQNVDTAKVRELTATILADRQALITVEATNIQLTLQLRSLIAGLKAKGNTKITQAALSQLKAYQAQIKTLQNDLAGTKGQIDKWTADFKQYRKKRDLSKAVAALEQVIAIQEARIKTKTDINNLLQQMIDILSAA